MADEPRVELITDDPTDYMRRHGKKRTAGGWLCLKPEGGIDDYFYTTNTDPNWFEMKGIKRIMQLRVQTKDRDLEQALRIAAEHAKGFSREERDHMLEAADRCAINKAGRQAAATVVPETADERLARIMGEQMGKGFERAAALTVAAPEPAEAEPVGAGKKR